MSPTQPFRGPVVGRVAAELESKIRSGGLLPGTRLPSVRQLARERRVSAFSAAEIYNALVAAGAVEARAGHGYYVARRRGPIISQQDTLREFPADSVWERRREALGKDIDVDAGCGWLPASWLHEGAVRVALHAVARSPDLRMEGYGSPYGMAALRSYIRRWAEDRGIAAREEQILTTQGASQALDLVVRECVSAGDAVVVEDPGYPPLFELIEQRGAQLLSVPRTEQGPDVDALERLTRKRRIRCFFTNTTCQNPTGTTTGLAIAQRIVELANAHDFLVVEDDIFADLGVGSVPTLASLSGLRRLIYISSFSKTISPALRCGFLLAAPALVQRLARAKVKSSLGSSELLEQVVLQIVTHGHNRRNLNLLRARLSSAHASLSQQFKQRGVEIACAPEGGLFMWARLPLREPVGKLWRWALRAGVLLAPGELFRPDGRACAYWRFNVAQCQSAAFGRFLDLL